MTDKEPARPVQTEPAPSPAIREEDFTISVNLDKALYHHKDEARITVVPSRDTYLHIFSIGQDQSITVLLPNRLAKSNFVAAGQSFAFPTSDHKRMGIRLRVALPHGAGRAVEEIKVVATKRAVDLVKGRIAEGIFQTYSSGDPTPARELQKELASLDPSEWTEMTVPYEIRQ